MERHLHLDHGALHLERADGDDLERQLALAEQRYAAARDASNKARAELRELINGKTVSPHLINSARARLDAVTARCVRLRTLIDDLEERLDM